MTAYETILTEMQGRVALLTLNRPKALNALNLTVMAEVANALGAFDADPGVGCIVITGNEKAFAAGADIKEMQPHSYDEMNAANWFAGWTRLGACAHLSSQRCQGLRLAAGANLR